MPHIIVKLFPGRTEEQKKILTERISASIMEIMNVEETSISVAFEEIPRENWKDKVYLPEIIGKEATLYKKPGYTFNE